MPQLAKQILHTSQHGSVENLKNIHKSNKNILHWSQYRCKTTGDSPLHLASKENNLEIVKYLCEIWLPCCIHIVNKDGKSALHDAAQFHNVEVLEYLISKGANVNMLKRPDWTPLMLACAKLSENIEKTYTCIKILIENNAERLIKNKDGWTCLHLAARLGDTNIFKIIWQYDVAELLMKSKNGADIYKYSKSGLSSLHLAAHSGMKEILHHFIQNCNFDVNLQSKLGKFTPLHCAYRAKQCDVVDLLLKLNANQCFEDEYGRLPNSYFF